VIYVAIIYFALYVFGTNTLKDFSDVEYDRIAGVRNFATVYGISKASVIVSIFLFIPFLWLGIVEFVMDLNSVVHLPVFFSLAMIFLLKKYGEKKSIEGNSILWLLFYLQFSLMMVTYALPFIL